VPAELPADLVGHLAFHLGAQRWYARAVAPPADQVSIVAAEELCPVPGSARHLYDVQVLAEGDRYQLLVGERPAGEPADFLTGRDSGMIQVTDRAFYYDATLDPELCLRLLRVVTAGTQLAARVRPISAEQSNTSLVYDDRIILKLYRRLTAGANPDVEVTNALARIGFPHVAKPYATWQREGYDLAYAQQFLAGGSEGWALAQTSLRDFYRTESDDPMQAGGDFSIESRQLGRVTGELHLAMREVWGADGDAPGRDWDRLVDEVEAGLADAAAPPSPASGPEEAGDPTLADGLDPERRRAVVDRLRAVRDPGALQRVHGDYHLGQVMRTDSGWYVLDFEGEPARDLSQRLRPTSPLKDVAGMLRSLDYAARVALQERTAAPADADARADAWVRANRRAFLAGYLAVPDVPELLAPVADRDLVLAGYELEKAIYELGYERAYRPGWVPVPAAAIARLVTELAGSSHDRTE